jgi:phenylalanyl-tRNA synthetase alpha chain
LPEPFPFLFGGAETAMTGKVHATLDSILGQALSAIDQAADSRQLEKTRVEFLGRHGSVTAQLKSIGSLPLDDRKAFGQAVNRARDQISDALTKKGECA